MNPLWKSSVSVHPLYENCRVLTVHAMVSHTISTNLGRQRQQEWHTWRGALGLLPPSPMIQAFQSGKVYFSSLQEPWGKPGTKASHNSLPNKSVYHFIWSVLNKWQQVQNSKAESMKVQHVFWLQESLIQSFKPPPHLCFLLNVPRYLHFAVNQVAS